MASQEFSIKIKCPPTPENKSKLLDALEERFGAIGTGERDGGELRVSKIKTFGNFFEAGATVELKEKEDGFSVKTLLNSKPSIFFWIQIGISVVLLFFGIGILIFALDAFFYFFGMKKLKDSINETLQKMQNDF